MKTPNVYVGTTKRIDWKTDPTPDDDGDRGVPREVVQILGFDPAEESMEKAKYTRRYRGPDGKWRYEYGQKKGSSTGSSTKGQTGVDHLLPDRSELSSEDRKSQRRIDLVHARDKLRLRVNKLDATDEEHLNYYTLQRELLNEGLERPSKIVGSGYKNPKKVARAQLDKWIAEYRGKLNKAHGGYGMSDIALVVTLEGLEKLEKAAYTRRWKGPDGKYRYEYGQKKGRRGSKTSSSDESKGSGPSKVEMETFEVLDDSSSENSRNMIREAVQANGREAVINHLHSYVQGNQSFQREGWNKKTITQLVSRATSKKLKKSSHGHPAKLSKVAAKAETNNPSSHKERMKFARMFAQMHGASKPEDESAHQPSTVDHKGREAGQKSPSDKGSTSVSGMSSQAHDNFGSRIMKPSELGASPYKNPAMGGTVRSKK